MIISNLVNVLTIFSIQFSIHLINKSEFTFYMLKKTAVPSLAFMPHPVFRNILQQAAFLALSFSPGHVRRGPSSSRVLQSCRLSFCACLSFVSESVSSMRFTEPSSLSLDISEKFLFTFCGVFPSSLRRSFSSFLRCRWVSAIIEAKSSIPHVSHGAEVPPCPVIPWARLSWEPCNAQGATHSHIVSCLSPPCRGDDGDRQAQFTLQSHPLNRLKRLKRNMSNFPSARK